MIDVECWPPAPLKTRHSGLSTFGSFVPAKRVISSRTGQHLDSRLEGQVF